jgi:hypothetical protein
MLRQSRDWSWEEVITWDIWQEKLWYRKDGEPYEISTFTL